MWAAVLNLDQWIQEVTQLPLSATGMGEESGIREDGCLGDRRMMDIVFVNCKQIANTQLPLSATER